MELTSQALHAKGPTASAATVLRPWASMHPLMCGRLLSRDSGESEPGLLMRGKPYRCPRGAAATELGSFPVSRLLVGGCMDSTDGKSYDPEAEVHVLSMCSAGKYGNAIPRGCMLPGAANFDPAASQPGPCLYPTTGCTNSTALNYNDEVCNHTAVSSR